ncbi:MAG: NUDIX hydrolase [Bacteroidetes bacterium]|nr:MAG: NUDIX hydrolase [Bacteroidota bacterium]
MSYTYEYPRPAVTTDAIVFMENVNGLEVLLIQRKNSPYKEMWALPGGFLEMDETLERCAGRELEEETGLSGIKLKQLHAFSTIDRDPRGRTIGVAFWGFTTKENSMAKGGDDASEAKWFPINKLPALAFDHSEILEMAILQIKSS